MKRATLTSLALVGFTSIAVIALSSLSYPTYVPRPMTVIILFFLSIGALMAGLSSDYD